MVLESTSQIGWSKPRKKKNPSIYNASLEFDGFSRVFVINLIMYNIKHIEKLRINESLKLQRERESKQREREREIV